jgi:hypothetical protein
VLFASRADLLVIPWNGRSQGTKALVDWPSVTGKNHILGFTSPFSDNALRAQFGEVLWGSGERPSRCRHSSGQRGEPVIHAARRAPAPYSAVASLAMARTMAVGRAPPAGA